LKELQNQKQQLETKISELETQQAGQLKQWQKDKIAAELIELRTILAETDTKIENNPKHAELAAQFPRRIGRPISMGQRPRRLR